MEGYENKSLRRLGDDLDTRDESQSSRGKCDSSGPKARSVEHRIGNPRVPGLGPGRAVPYDKNKQINKTLYLLRLVVSPLIFATDVCFFYY